MHLQDTARQVPRPHNTVGTSTKPHSPIALLDDVILTLSQDRTLADTASAEAMLDQRRIQCVDSENGSKMDIWEWCNDRLLISHRMLDKTALVVVVNDRRRAGCSRWPETYVES